LYFILENDYDKTTFPAEWENQQGILLCFPHNGRDWPGKEVQWAFIEFIKKVLMKRCF
jgi:agmatine/peptidylarginine deiminase